MKEIVWVFGTSASGKETFIKHVIQNPGNSVIKQLGWSNKKLSICESSLKYIPQFYRDPITDKREEVPGEIERLLRAADVVLIKWQAVDAKANLPQRVKERFPKARHKLLRLNVGRDELTRRLLSRSWWTDVEDRKTFIDDELRFVNDEVNKLSVSNFDVVQVDANHSGSYQVIEV